MTLAGLCDEGDWGIPAVGEGGCASGESRSASMSLQGPEHYGNLHNLEDFQTWV